MWGPMKLSKLYSNKNDCFKPLQFNPGLNVILAEIRQAENKEKDTHNLGKSTLAKVIDFALLKSVDANHFLKVNKALFNDFVFFLEIELISGSYVTVRRSVSNPTKIAFKKHETPVFDLADLPLENWDHFNIPFDKAKKMLDAWLNFEDLKSWSFRSILGYLLRSQDDFQDIFHLKKNRSKDSDWKPFLTLVLGLNGLLVKEQYTIEESINGINKDLQELKNEFGSDLDISKISGKLLLSKDELGKKQKMLDAFDFHVEDLKQTEKLVNELSSQIALLNNVRYSLMFNQKKVTESLENSKFLFTVEDMQQLFREAGILFDGQIKKDFHQLIMFNKSIDKERRGYLKQELDEISSKLKELTGNLSNLEDQRRRALSFISGEDVFTKYKALSKNLVALNSDIMLFERQLEIANKQKDLRQKSGTLKERLHTIEAKIIGNIEIESKNEESLFSKLRLYFNEIVQEVIDKKVLLSVRLNNSRHIEYDVEILDTSGHSTNENFGHSYRKLLCIAFDLALLRAHLNGKFPRFVYHDGLLESLDDRKKEKLLNVIRRYSNLGIQSIITVIDSDLPSKKENKEFFEPSEIILTLHDEGREGRLFKTKAW